MESVNETVEKVFGNYPETVLQFGEGNFLRAFADWMIDLANISGAFRGSIVLCQPIATGLTNQINQQNGIYTVVMRGIENGNPVEQFHTVTSVSRCINPYQDYHALLDLAKSPDLKVIISNTTEAGITYHEGDCLQDEPPFSYPAKLCAFLYFRFKAFNGAANRGLLILPVELIDDNGAVLKQLVLRYAEEWHLESNFIEWLNNCNEFTSTLVDRIVTGFPKDTLSEFEAKLGYRDNLLVTCEPFNLWVIQGDAKWKEVFPVHKTTANVIWTDDVVPYKKRKVRILNGSHTAAVPCAFLAGYDTVLDFFATSPFGAYERALIDREILPILDMPQDELIPFAAAVEERFRNPYIKHHLIDITLNNHSKFKARCLPTMLEYYQKTGQIPIYFAFALAGFIRFYNITQQENQFIGHRDSGESYEVHDDHDTLVYFYDLWRTYGLLTITEKVLRNTQLWGFDLEEKMPGLSDKVFSYLQEITETSIEDALLQNKLG